MTPGVWSWILFGLTVLSVVLMWQVGNGKRWAWLVLAIGNLPWFAYAIQTHQWGFVAIGLLYITVELRNWMRWGR